MERRPDESFAEYKVRRAAVLPSVLKEKAALRGGTQTSRQKQRDAKRANGTLSGTYGKDIMAAFDSRRPDLAKRQERHATYLLQQEAKRALRRGELKLAA